ncbi:MAG: hypothetical protein IJS08_01810 [Victivallales bacterium]|nr:hypothetical protein [Victivallales bacterium]
MRNLLAILLVLAMFHSLAADFGVQAWKLQAAVFFLEHPGGDLHFQCKLAHPKENYTEKTGSGTTPAALLTLYTPDEHVYKDFYWRDSKGELATSFSCIVPDAKPGIWQIRVANDERSKCSFKFDTMPGKIEGIMPARCWLWHQTGAMLDGTFVMVPPNATQDLKVNAYNCQIEFLELDGRTVAKVDKGSQLLKLTPGKIYKYRNSTKQPSWNWSGYLGYPVIFCSSQQFAEKLNASLIEIDDMHFVPLGVQKRILEWKKSLRKEDLQVPEFKLEPLKEKFLADKESRCLLEPTGLLSSASFLLSQQDIEPSSTKFGHSPQDISGLAFLYALDRPYNPYFKCKGLLNRVSLYWLNTMAQQRPLRENGTIFETSSNYAGADGMLHVNAYTAFAQLAPAMPEDVKTMWSEALGYPLRRFFSDRVSCENQSAHWPAKLFLYGQATNLQIFKDMAEDFVENLADTARDRFIRTGYLQESYGPDASYMGISTCLLAYYALLSNSRKALSLLDRIFNFMNHTVAPEPGSTLFYGASGFSHRTPAPWNLRQYGGGTRLLADKLDSAACLHRHIPEKSPWNAKEVERLLFWISRNKLKYYAQMSSMAVEYAYSPYAQLWYSLPYVQPRQNAKLPAEFSEGFIHNFNNEFIFLRKASYYTGIYAGSTATPNVPWNKNAIYASGAWKEENGIRNYTGSSCAQPVQGAQIFWTPEYGTALISMNWSLFTQWNCYIKGSDEYVFPDYFTASSKFDEASGMLEIRHKFRNSKASVERRFTFEDDSLTIDIRVQDKPENMKLLEQLPYISKEGIKLEFCSNGNWKTEAGDAVSAIRWSNGSGAGILLTFSSPVNVHRAPSQFKYQYMTVASLEAEADATEISYTLSPINAK